MTQESNEILGRINRTFDRYIERVEGMEQERFNRSLTPDSWSAAQVCDHILKVGFSILRLLSGEGKPVDRDPTAKIESIGEAFADMEKKFRAFGPIKPDDQPLEPDRVVSRFKGLHERFRNYLEQDPDLTLLCVQFAHPLFDTMTRLEWLYFTVYHNERHLQQLRRIINNT